MVTEEDESGTRHRYGMTLTVQYLVLFGEVPAGKKIPGDTGGVGRGTGGVGRGTGGVGRGTGGMGGGTGGWAGVLKGEQRY